MPNIGGPSLTQVQGENLVCRCPSGTPPRTARAHLAMEGSQSPVMAAAAVSSMPDTHDVAKMAQDSVHGAPVTLRRLPTRRSRSPGIAVGARFARGRVVEKEGEAVIVVEGRALVTWLLQAFPLQLRGNARLAVGIGQKLIAQGYLLGLTHSVTNGGGQLQRTSSLRPGGPPRARRGAVGGPFGSGWCHDSGTAGLGGLCLCAFVRRSVCASTRLLLFDGGACRIRTFLITGGPFASGTLRRACAFGFSLCECSV